MEIFWTMLASQDRKRIREYIAEQNLMAAIELDERIGYSASSLAGQPYKGCQRQDYWPFFAIFNVRYWSLMLSAFRHFIITDWRGVFCQHSRFAFFL
ncbi:type II toxin-antitoxin system RelE/ParE family toxin [Escherichia coli]